MSYNKKDEDADTIVKVDRTSVFQEARVFNSSPISPRKCRILLTKISLLLFTGENFPVNEATTLFFGISKLFQNKDASLRQMVYLVIKELAQTAEDVIMVTSSIMKDTAASSDVIYRANAIRALCRVIDASTVQAIERLIKTAIVDKTPSVSSAALVSSYHLFPVARDVVRRWQSETQEAASAAKSSGGFSLGFGSSSQHSLAASNTNFMTQYHAIGLLYQMRSHDRMALVKMVQQYSAAGVVKSPVATMLLVRLSAKLAEEDSGLRKPMMQLLDGWLRHKSEMVNFEAAKAICDMRDVTDAEIAQAVHVLQLFLTSPRAVTKFAAIRILHNFASFKPDAVRACNPDIEALITNSNRSIATFAITTLLKTGNESTVDKLMKQISGFMAEITDEFKVTIVEAIRTLCLKFPKKQADMLAFISGILRDEGGYEFKRAVVESMFDLIKHVPESKENALAHLCEFIEDCEFTKLSVRVLHLLGMEGPKTEHPTRYIRYIYNRVVLENSIVRAAAVTALAKFGVGQKNPEVKSSVHVLLTRCLDDTDDEVRDRAALNLRLMDQDDDDLAEKFVRNDSMFSLHDLEHQLVMYVTAEDKDNFISPFDLSTVPVVTREQADAEDRTKKLTTATPTLKAPSTGPEPGPGTGAGAGASATAKAQKEAQEDVQQLQAVPEFADYGGVLKSSQRIELTEPILEIVVEAVKYTFKNYYVLQFRIKNTFDKIVLTDVTVESIPSYEVDYEVDDEPLSAHLVTPAPEILPGKTGYVHVSFEGKKGPTPFLRASFKNTVKYIETSLGEPVSSGSSVAFEYYPVEKLELSVGDYISPAYASKFDYIWAPNDQVGGKYTATEKCPPEHINEHTKSIEDAMGRILKTLSLQPLDGTEVAPSKFRHTLRLYGKTISGGKVTATVDLAPVTRPRIGVIWEINARADEEEAAALVVSSVAEEFST